MMNPRLTFLITDLHRGGAPLLLADLAPGLAAKKWDVEVVSIAPEGEIAPLLRAQGIHTTSLAAQGCTDLSIVPRFARHLNLRRPDIVCSVLIHANLLSVLVRPLLNVRPGWVQSIHTLQDKPAWHWTLQGMLSSFAHGIVVPSIAILKKLAAHGPLPAAKAIPNGIDGNRFRTAQPIPPADRPWPADAVVVGYVGRFDPVKRLDLLLRAAAQLIHGSSTLSSRLHIALVGYGAEEKWLRGLAANLGITSRVHFVGITKEPQRWYKTFDLFCSPSPAEGFGLTLVEAAAAGLKVIACRTDAVAETLDHAFWIPSDSTPHDLVQAIDRALAVSNWSGLDPADLEGPYSLQRMIEAYHAYFSTMLHAT